MKQARARYPNAPEPFIDLSTGINPRPYPIPPLPAEAWARLPEPEDIAALEATAARAYGADDLSLAVAAPGTQALIALLPRLFPHASVAILSPTYGEYSRAFIAAESGAVAAERLQDLQAAPCAVICNPNNPDGRRFDAAALLNLLHARPKDGLLIVDEAFADFEDAGLSLVPHLPQPGLIVLRSFSKAYGLGGLRLAFALGGGTQIAPLRHALGSWPVSGPAVEIGRHALADRAFLEDAKRRLEFDVHRLDALLVEAGLTVVGGTRLFRLAAGERAAEIASSLGQAGILVRSFDYRQEWLRFGIPGDESAWMRLTKALT